MNAIFFPEWKDIIPIARIVGSQVTAYSFFCFRCIVQAGVYFIH